MSAISTVPSHITLSDGIKMPTIGLGTYRIDNNGDAVECIKYAVDLGYRLIDTAAFYRNEDQVGQAVKSCGLPREQVFIVTKLRTQDHGAEQCKKAFLKSKRLLECDCVDLYLMHSPTGGKILETYDAIVELKQQGLVRSVGVSNFGVHHLEELRKAGRPIPSVNQIELHPFLKQTDIVNYCRTHNIALMAYAPVARMTQATHPTLTAIAARHSKSVAQIMIRWCLQQGFIPVPKSSVKERIAENFQVFDFSLTADDLAEIDLLPEVRCCWDAVASPWEG